MKQIVSFNKSGINNLLTPKKKATIQIAFKDS